MLFLHGIRESVLDPRGDPTNNQDLQTVERHGPPSAGARPFNRYFVVISPQHRQAPYTWNTDELRLLLDHFASNAVDYVVDPQRVVITGISIGAVGAWELANDRRPNNGWRIRALALASPYPAVDAARQRNDLPTWVHYGTSENNDIPTRAREIYRNTAVARRHTEVDGGGHNGATWTPLFHEEHHTCWGFYAWLDRASA
jgi:dienelactone hydrolase